MADVYYKVDVMAVKFRGEEMVDCLLFQVKSSKGAAESVVPKLVEVEDYLCKVALRIFYPDLDGRGFKEVRL